MDNQTNQIIDNAIVLEKKDIVITSKCSRCNKNVKIYAVGKCKSCYNYLKRNIEKNKEYYKKWKDKNPDYFKNYYLNQKDRGGKRLTHLPHVQETVGSTPAPVI